MLTRTIYANAILHNTLCGYKNAPFGRHIRTVYIAALLRGLFSYFLIAILGEARSIQSAHVY